MAARQVNVTRYQNQTTMQQEPGLAGTHAANGIQQGDTSDITSVQTNMYPIRTQTRSVRKGSVTMSRQDSVLLYKGQYNGQQRTGTFSQNVEENTGHQTDTTSPNPSGHTNDLPAVNNWPSHARRHRTQTENGNDGQKKDGRGVLKGIKVSKKRFANGSGKLSVEFSDRLGGSVGLNYRSFVDDVVVYMKRRAPLIGVTKWSDINSSIKGSIVEDVIGSWDLQDTKATHDKILTICKERYRGWRSTLHATYQAYNTDVARLANKPEDVKIEEWEWLIDYFGTDKFKEISQKNSENRRKQKAKHRAGSKSYAQYSYEQRNPETGEEPDDITLWEVTHTKKGEWANSESQAVYDNACAQVSQKEREIEGAVSTEERNNIFQSSYRTTMGCTSTRAHGYGYMAKPPSDSQRIRAELEEQARATNETQRQNVQLNHQVNDLKDQLEKEREERERVEKQLEQGRVERERGLEEERRARQLEMHAMKQSMMAEMAQMMGTQQTTTQQFSQSRSARNAKLNVSRPLFQDPSSNVDMGGNSTIPRMISSHQLMQAAKNGSLPRANRDALL